MSVSEHQTRVQQAVTTMETGTHADYLAATIRQRAGANGQGIGSVYPELDDRGVKDAINNADWQPYTHPAVMKGCTAFQAPLPGLMGLVDLSTMNEDAQVLLVDPKKTGFASVITQQGERMKTGHTTLILGQDKNEEIIFTFHPGDPVAPSTIASNGIAAQLTTVADAQKRGFGLAKLAGADEWQKNMDIALSAKTDPRAVADAPKLAI